MDNTNPSQEATMTSGQQTAVTLSFGGRRYRVIESGATVVETLVIGRTKAFWRPLPVGRLRDRVLRETRVVRERSIKEG